jgi:putative heme iron utilization protein
MKFSSVILALMSSSAASAFAPTTNPTFSTRSISSNNHKSTQLFHGEPKHAPQHDTGSPVEMDPEEMKTQAAFAKHQQNAPKLDFAADVRTLIEYNHGFAVMSTNSKSTDGYPNGSVVGFAPDENGNPIFIFSGMSSHTQDVLKDPRCSLTVASKQFKGAADGRVNLMGQVKLVPKDEKEAMKAVYLKKHPGAFWVEFGDFNFFKMEIEKTNFVGGFARAGSITPEEYKNAKPDTISEFGMQIAAHMNDDHQGSTIAMIESQVSGINASEAIITSVDSMGMYVKVTRSPVNSEEQQQFKMRLPFPRKAESRKDVKNIIVEMTRAAAPAPAAEA